MVNEVALWQYNICHRDGRGMCTYGDKCCRFHAETWEDVLVKYPFLFEGRQCWSRQNPHEVSFQASYPQYTSHWPKRALDTVPEKNDDMSHAADGGHSRNATDNDPSQSVRLLVQE
jgi:hypothetical protein